MPVYPNHTDRSVYINHQALPLLVQETLQPQNCPIPARLGRDGLQLRVHQSLQSASARRRRSSGARRRRPAPPHRARHGDAGRGRRPRPEVDRRGSRCRFRLAARRRRDLQHLQGRKRDQPAEPRRVALADAHPDLRAIARRCEALRAETDGYFDATCGGRRVNPSGLVKGWAVDRAAVDPRRVRLPRTTRSTPAATSSCAAARCRIPLARRDPAPAGVRSAVAAVVEGDDLAVATSGEYARGRPRASTRIRVGPRSACSRSRSPGPTLQPPTRTRPLRSRWARRGPHWTARLHGYEAMTILADERVLSTPGFPSAH